MARLALTEQLRPHFELAHIRLGQRAHEEGRVGAIRPVAGFLLAHIKELRGRGHDVDFAPKQGAFGCTCQDFYRRNSCPHVWAFALALDELIAKNGIRRWRPMLDAIAHAESERDDRERSLITYGLDADPSRTKDFALTVYAQKRLKNGSFGKPRIASADDTESLAADDAALFALLSGARRVGENSYAMSYGYGFAPRRSLELDLPAATLSSILGQLIATGRFFEYMNGEARERAYDADPATDWRPRLRLGPGDPRPIEVEFHSKDRVIPFAEVATFILPNWFLVGLTFHRFADDVDCRWLGRLIPNDLEVPAADVPEFYDKVLATSLGSQFELDEGWERVQLEAEKIKPIIQVKAVDGHRLRVGIEFDYDGLRTHETGFAAAPDSSARRIITRARSIEEQHRRAAADHLHCLPQELEYTEFSPLELLPKLDELGRNGFVVEVEGRPLRHSGAVSSKVSSGTDWFDLEGGIDFEGQHVSYPEILAGLKKGNPLLRLSDGSHGILPEDWRRKFELLDAATPMGDILRFRRNQGLLIDLLLESTPQPSLDAAFKKLSQGLRNFQGIDEKKEGRGFAGELRAYQRKGLGWLSFLREIGLGGCLADDMGLGKTVQVLAHLQQVAGRKGSRKPFLVVAPKSVTSNWLNETRRFTPKVAVVEYEGAQRKDLLAELPPSSLVVTTYGLLRRDIEVLRQVEFDTVILDEAQAIKNASAQTAKAARLLQADHRLALSGTPIENRIEELWSLFGFLNPGMFPSMKILRELGEGGTEERKRLGQLVAPFLLRRKKEQVALDLPTRTEQTIFCEMEPKQRKLYDEVLKYQRMSVLTDMKKNGLERSKLHVLEALLRLRQIACHPALVDESYAAVKSSKLDVLMEYLTEVISEGHKALVFSQFTSLLGHVRKMLDKQKIAYEYLDGSTRDRATVVARFQNDASCPVFLISIKAGGTGLNLTAADYVFILDPWWNPAVEAQAIDRSHRIGQTRQVVAYRLIAKDTIEEKILALQDQKKELADSILEGNATTLRDLSREDIEALFA